MGIGIGLALPFFRLPDSGVVPALWTPAEATTDGGVLPHTWEVPGVDNFQDTAKTIPADEIGDVVGAAVSQGTDTHDVTQATTANKPTLQQVTINDVTSYVWRFDGTNDFLQGAFGGGAISQPFTVFAVARLDASAAGDGSFHFMIESDDAGNRMIHDQTNANVWRIFGGSSIVDGASNANWNIWTSLFNGASSQLWHNGVSLASGNAGATTPDGITVGASPSGSNLWRGDIGQIIIYPGNLSTADKNQVGEYIERVTGIVWTTIV